MSTNDTDSILSSIQDALLNEDTLKIIVESVLTQLLTTPDFINKIVDAAVSNVKQTLNVADICTNTDATKKNAKSIKALEDKCKSLEAKLDDIEQYSRRNCLLLHGVKESRKEDTTTTALTVLNETLGTELDRDDIDRSHRIGSPNKTSLEGERPKPRPIIIKFISYQQRRSVFSQKRKFKNSDYLITESLTKARMSTYRAAQKLVKEERIQSVWSVDGSITVLTNEERKVTIKNDQDLEELS